MGNIDSTNQPRGPIGPTSTNIGVVSTNIGKVGRRDTNIGKADTNIGAIGRRDKSSNNQVSRIIMFSAFCAIIPFITFRLARAYTRLLSK